MIVGLDTSDDAAVYKVNDEVAMIQTVDFFTPVVDDPYTFGTIAAANALSDVYAMGGDAKVALNIVGFPSCLDPWILGEILKGGADKVLESGAVLVGGHSVQSPEPLYGLCVSGFIHPDRIWTNFGAKPGDVLILTKQIGSGIINTSVKAEMGDPESLAEAITVMSSLNKYASYALRPFTVHACTDVTGFGLLGHLFEMVDPSEVTARINVHQVPLIQNAKDYAEEGLVPGGSYKNRQYTGKNVDLGDCDADWFDVLYDPQTSGGLLFAIPEEEADAAMKALKEAQLETKAAIIGDIVEPDEKRIKLIS